MSSDLIRIGLIFEYSLSYYRDISPGVRASAESRPRWAFTPIAPDHGAIESIHPLELDGLIAHIFTMDMAESIVPLRKPAVHVSGRAFGIHRGVERDPRRRD